MGYLAKRDHALGRPDHIALIVWEFPPSVSGGVYRPAALARYLTRNGVRVSVIAGPAPPRDEVTVAGEALADYVGSITRVYRLDTQELRPSYSMFPRIDGSFASALRLFLLGLTSLRRDYPVAVIASGPPFSTFVAGKLLAHAMGARLLLDYRDEWTANPFPFVSAEGVDLRWERSCLESAELVVYTTESQRQHALRLFRTLDIGKTAVVPNGWEPNTSGRQPKETASDATLGPAVLLFAGRLGGHTSPHEFLKCLARIVERNAALGEAILLRFLGPKSPDVESLVLEYSSQIAIECLELVPQEEAQRLMREADALLLFHDHRFERYLPGKLYEYVASGTQILLFGGSGESQALISRLEAGWTVSAGNDHALERVLLKILESRGARSLRADKRPNVNASKDKWLSEHTREHLSIAFAELAMSKIWRNHTHTPRSEL